MRLGWQINCLRYTNEIKGDGWTSNLQLEVAEVRALLGHVVLDGVSKVNYLHLRDFLA